MYNSSPPWRKRADQLLDVWGSCHVHWRRQGTLYPPYNECCDIEHLIQTDPPVPMPGQSADIIADQSERMYDATARKYERRNVMALCEQTRLTVATVDSAMLELRCPHWLTEMLQMIYPQAGRFVQPDARTPEDILRDFESETFLRATGGHLYGKYLDRARYQIKRCALDELERVLGKGR